MAPRDVGGHWIVRPLDDGPTVGTSRPLSLDSTADNPEANSTPSGEPASPPAPAATLLALDPFSRGYLVGLLVGEGHFGGDGRQPQVTLRMHIRHERLFRWLVTAVPGGRLYGPYHHGGRHYYQWMVRGPALREQLWPLLLDALPLLDDHVRDRVLRMATRYGLPIDRADDPP